MTDFAFAALRLIALLGAAGFVSIFTYRLSTFLTSTKTGPRP